MMWAGLALIIILSIVLISLPSSSNIGNIGGTGFSFQACTDYAEGSPDCTTSTNVLVQSEVPKTPISVRLTAASGSFKYQGTPRSWSFACSGTMNFGNGQSSPISASASGSGSPPASWPISITPKQWNLSTVYASSYGQKNLTAQLGSKASPCSLSVSFVELSSPVKVYYRYASLAKWSVNYQPTTIYTTTTSSQTTTTSMTTPQTTSATSTSTSGGNTVTTTQTDIWTTTVTAATGGKTGNEASSGVGIIVTLAQDYYFPQQSVIWTFIPASFSSQCQGNYDKNCFVYVNLVTPDTSTTATIGLGGIGSTGVWIQSPSLGPVSRSTYYAVAVSFAQRGSNPTQIFFQVVPVSDPNSANIPPAPYDVQYANWLEATYPQATRTTTSISGSTYTTYYTSTVGTDSATTSFATSSALSPGQTLGDTCLRKCALSIVGVSF